MTAKEFLYSLPGKVHPGALEGVETVFHFNLSGEGGGQYTLRIQNGELDVMEGLQEEPKCTVSGDAGHFLDVCTGKLNPMMAVMTGKVKISNTGEMMRYAKKLGLM